MVITCEFHARNCLVFCSIVAIAYACFLLFFFLVYYIKESHGGLYKSLKNGRKKKAKRLGGERDQIKFIDLGFERWQVVRFRNARSRQDDP